MNLKAVVTNELFMPRYAHVGDAGMDIVAAEDARIDPGDSVRVKTGVSVQIPEGCVGLVFPRSGIGSSGLTMRNAVGVIDSGYRGEIQVALWNTTDDCWIVETGDRIAQLVVMPFVSCEIELCDSLDDSERGSDGYGSTGDR